MSSATIFPPRTVKAPTENGTPSRVVTAPATPFTSAGCVNRLNWANSSARRATASAPHVGPEAPKRPAAPAGTAPWSARTTTSGSSTASSASKSPLTRGGQEGVDHLALALQVDVGDGRFALNAPAGTAGQLTRRLGGAFHDGGDLVEGHGEDVVQDEGQPLGGAERVQDHQQGDADRVGEERLVLGVRPAGSVEDDVGHVRLERVLTPGATGAQDVQRDP